ncbi:EAL domain-containing protein [Rhodobacterales bacterium HKCCE2091]|nr:EAL domain-containing protein [Rhodobacterales bacterium HKCCE2091]
MCDGLTGLCNFRSLERFKAALKSGAPQPIGILRIDLDRFKLVNDTFGHAAGDRVLEVTAERLRAAMPDGSRCFRTGGDEFVMVCPGACDDASLMPLARSLTASLTRDVQFDAVSIHFGASIGLAVGTVPATEFDEILSHADIALYEVKKRGRGGIGLFTQEMHDQLTERRALADEFQSALERDEIRAVFQPQFDAATGAVIGAEALVRWHHPTRGILSPGRFLEVAEALDLLVPIDRFVMAHALGVAQRLADEGTPLPRLSLNVSFRRLVDPSLTSDLNFYWTDRRTPLSIELVETIFFDDGMDEVTAHNIDRLREMGVRIEMDDFGSGHASITGLLAIRPDVVKIDRSLVSPITEDDERRRLLATVLDIARVLDIEVVAEGVETLEQAAMLRRMGCDVLQGFALAPPMSDVELTAFMAEQARIGQIGTARPCDAPVRRRTA